MVVIGELGSALGFDLPTDKMSPSTSATSSGKWYAPSDAAVSPLYNAAAANVAYGKSWGESSRGADARAQTIQKMAVRRAKAEAAIRAFTPDDKAKVPMVATTASAPVDRAQMAARDAEKFKTFDDNTIMAVLTALAKKEGYGDSRPEQIQSAGPLIRAEVLRRFPDGEQRIKDIFEGSKDATQQMAESRPAITPPTAQAGESFMSKYGLMIGVGALAVGVGAFFMLRKP